MHVQWRGQLPGLNSRAGEEKQQRCCFAGICKVFDVILDTSNNQHADAPQPHAKGVVVAGHRRHNTGNVPHF